MNIDFFTMLSLMGFPVKEARASFMDSGLTPGWQTGAAWEIFNFHYSANPFYRSLINTPPRDWEEIPVLTRDHLRGNPADKLPAGTKIAGLYNGSTSGSSGDPLYFARDGLTHAMVWLNVEKLYNSVGISVNDRQARVFGMSGMTLAKARARIKDFLSNRYRFNIFDLSDKALALWVKKFRHEKFNYIYGYTNTLVLFARYLEKNQITLSTIAPTLKGCIVTSEVCTNNDAETIKNAFGIPVYNEYGSSELGILGFKTGENWRCSDNMVKFEVLDENNQPLPDGATGFLTCTSLFNRGTPFIRYRLGDLASIRRVNGTTLITGLMGSMNDMAILPSGKKVPGISVYFIAEPLIKKAPHVREFLVRQTESGFTFEYVSDKDLSPNEASILGKSFESMLEKGVRVQTSRVETLQRGSNGKFKHFISSIDDGKGCN